MNPMTSESVAAIYGALVSAQRAVKGAAKDSTNPYFKSRYADLSSVWDACRDALAANGLAVIQMPGVAPPDYVRLTTRVVHSSGEWIEAAFDMPLANTSPQGMGSAMTYARRYALAAFLGVCPEDDDGQAAEKNGSAKKSEHDDEARWDAHFIAAAGGGRKMLEAAWRGASENVRDKFKEEWPRYDHLCGVKP